MQIPILIEPIEGGRFRARAGEPFGSSAEAASADEAIRALQACLNERLQSGSRLATLNLSNGDTPDSAPLDLRPLTPAEKAAFDRFREEVEKNRRRDGGQEPMGALPPPFGFVPATDDDWAFHVMEEEIARLRRLEDGASE